MARLTRTIVNVERIIRISTAVKLWHRMAHQLSLLYRNEEAAWGRLFHRFRMISTLDAGFDIRKKDYYIEDIPARVTRWSLSKSTQR